MVRPAPAILLKVLPKPTACLGSTVLSPPGSPHLKVRFPRFKSHPAYSTTSSAISSSNAAATKANTQTNLLDLLKFAPAGSQGSSQQPQRTEAAQPTQGNPEAQSTHGRGISASDLVASLRANTPKPTSPAQSLPRSSSAAHQDSLLKLLNRTTSGLEDQPSNASYSNQGNKAPRDTPSADRTSSPIRFFGSKENTPTPFQPEALPKAPPNTKNGPIFTYVNPFEQLSASSPLNAQNGDSSKRKVKSPSPAAVHDSSRRKLTSSGDDVLQSIESPEPKPLNDGRTQVEALMGIGAPSKDAETVAEALNEVGGQVHKQMEHALAEAEEKRPQIKQEEREEAGISSGVESFSKQEPNVSATRTAKASKEESAPAKNIEEWENMDDEGNTKRGKGREVPTYQFPMKPFVCIEVKKESSDLNIREDSVIHIARFRKDFDQTDRTLATATKDFIVYGMPKNGGVRVIQQENGSSSLLFPNTQDRIFNVAISTAYSGDTFQRVIATGVSGSVYWTSIADPGLELTQSDMEAQAVVFPPITAAADSSALGGQLKTRAKKSNRHPDFFAIGRGKSIQIVFPGHARNSEFFGDASKVDTEKYFGDRSLKVNTGKAGKDFAFSEDDSTIVTLDKAGRLRIWDIGELVAEENSAPSKLAPIEVKTPMLTFSTAPSTSEKYWPTSVLFVDKIRAYVKGIAQRYIIVGMKQNHTLQLWDLCLEKAVQELSFPHSSEGDAICSVAFHPASGIIVVGHPTRNSIYLIHLSAPRYNLPGMPQAKFIQRLASKDQSLPKAEATAIMSGFREYSLSNIGQLRSLELAPSAGDPSKGVEDLENPQLFDLYVMHSKGVTCLAFTKEDLGWSPDNKALYPIDAAQENLIVLKDLREQSLPSSVNGDTSSSVTPSKGPAKSAPKDFEKVEKAATPSAMSRSVEKSEIKRTKQNGAIETNSKAAVVASASAPSSKLAQRASSPVPQTASQAPKESVIPTVTKLASRDTNEPTPAASNERSSRSIGNGEPISMGISSELLDKEMKKIELGVSGEFSKTFQRELDALYRRLDSDKQVQNAATGANQEAILRLVSKQLGDNVEKSLTSIVTKGIKDTVTPFIAEVTTSTLDRSLPHIISQQMQHLLPVSMRSVVPDAITRTMQSAEIYRAVSDQVIKSVTGHVDREFGSNLQSYIIPTFQNLTISTAQKITQETEARVRDQLEQAEVKRREDAAKIDHLSDNVRILSETIHQMAEAQSTFQSEILRLQERAMRDNQANSRHDTPTPSDSASMQASPEQKEAEAVSAALQKRSYEEATIMVRTLV